MDIKISTALVQVQTVPLTKNILSQLETFKGMKEEWDQAIWLYRVDGGIIHKDWLGQDVAVCQMGDATRIFPMRYASREILECLSKLPRIVVLK